MVHFWSHVLLLGACLQQASCAPAYSISDATSSDASTTSTSQPASTPGKGVQGPELAGLNFPDPSIIWHSGLWYAFATRTRGSSIHIQAATSPNYKDWTLLKDSNGTQFDALPDLPAWVYANSSNTWAPDVSRLANGSFIMYYSASTAQDRTKHCIGAAISPSVQGPYIPVSDNALICPLDQGGAIDASGFYDAAAGKRYIVYKVDGNSLGNGGACLNTIPPIKPTPLVLQRVRKDGITFLGQPTTLLDNDGVAVHDGLSDNGILEAPVMVRRDDTYFLFFSSGCFTTANYTVSYATSAHVRGPYERVYKPLLRTGDYGLRAPGGADVTKDGKRMVFHANYGSGRAMYTADVRITGTDVVIL